MDITAVVAAPVSVAFFQAVVTYVVFIFVTPVEVDDSLPGFAGFAIAVFVVEAIFAYQAVFGFCHFAAEMILAAEAAFGCAILAVGFSVDQDGVFGVDDAAALCTGDDVGGLAVDGVDVLHCDLPFCSLWSC